MMMSMRSDALWISWIINFIALLLPLSILLTIAGSKLFAYSRGQYIFLYFFVFFLSAMSYSIFMSIFFSKARTASIVGSLIFFSGWFINLGMTLTSTWATTTSKVLLLLLLFFLNSTFSQLTHNQTYTFFTLLSLFLRLLTPFLILMIIKLIVYNNVCKFASSLCFQFCIDSVSGI